MACDFLKSVANYYCDHYEPEKWKDITFVFPSHRACVFFRQVLSDVLIQRNITIYGARTVTFDDLITEKALQLKTPLRKADKIVQAFELYSTYSRLSKHRATENGNDVTVDFARFYTWVPMFLGDFEDVDKYMVNPHEIFSSVLDFNNLSDDLSHLSDEQRAAIQTLWNVQFEKYTEINFSDDGNKIEEVKYFHNRFVRTYELLSELYSEFNNALAKQGLAYTGKLYREVANAYINGDITEPENVHYAFVGFNALTESEIRIFKYLSNKADRVAFFWDYTQQMLEPIKVPTFNDKGQQVGTSELEYGPGRFMRTFVDRFKAPSDFELPQFDRTEEDKINIYLYAYPQGQMDRVAKFLADEQVKKDCFAPAPRTAIVLTDENMLLPVVASLPPDDPNLKVNITMGYPLKFSQAYGLVDLLKRLHIESSLYSKSSATFYHRMVMPILQHPCIARLCTTDVTYKIINEIVSKNIVRIDAQIFSSNEILKYIFAPLNASNVAEYMKHIFKLIANCEDCDEISRECAAKIVQIANRFDDVLDKYKENLGNQTDDLKVVLSMFCSLVNGQNVDLLGEPLGGLQIMGILETRTIDFDNIIVMDLNEGVFPKKNAAMTFIPYVIRQAFGLPTHEFQDSIFSYYFFRLIHRAKRVNLLYSESTDAERQGPSRFLQQIKYELGLPTREVVVVHNNQKNIRQQATGIVKTSDILKLLSERFDGNGKKVLSPTALTNYIKCPIYFFIANVMRVDDADEVQEEADMRILGNIFHDTMQDLYSSKVGKIVTKTDRELLLKDKKKIEQLILKNFGKSLSKDENYFSSVAELFGRNILTYNLVFRMVCQMLEKDSDEFVIDGVEKEITLDQPLKIGNISVAMGGKIDRLQHEDYENEQRTFILDYKTGKDVKTKIGGANTLEDVVDNLFDAQKIEDTKAILQTLVYAYILYNNDKSKKYSLAVVYIKSLMGDNDPDYKITFGKANNLLVYDSELDALFSKRLTELVEEIYSSDTIFGRSKKIENCEKCKFVSFCKTMNYIE